MKYNISEAQTFKYHTPPFQKKRFAQSGTIQSNEIGSFNLNIPSICQVHIYPLELANSMEVITHLQTTKFLQYILIHNVNETCTKPLLIPISQLLKYNIISMYIRG